MVVRIRFRPEAVVTGFRSFASGIPGACLAGNRQAADYGFKDADPKVPIRTGQLKRSGGIKRVTPEGATYGWDAHYATYVNFGTIRQVARNFATPGYRSLQNGLAANFIFQNLLRI
jgi:hypothetical protein